MRLIAKKPCNFGGRKFYIGEEIPKELVAEPKAQERLGVITVANDENAGVSDEKSGTLYTQEQLNEAVAKVRAELEDAAATLEETAPGVYEGTVQIAIKTGSDGNNDQIMAIPATQEQIQQTFEIMQLNAEKASGAIAGITDENVLTMLAFIDSRNTVKKAAKNRLDNLFSTDGETNEAGNGNDTREDEKKGET